MPRNRALFSRPANRQASLCLWAALLLTSAAPARAGQGLDAAIQSEQARLKAPAVSVAVMEKGKVVYAKAFGSADVENGVTATVDTRFRIASVAKTMTATAVLQLHERGILDLDAPIQTYCAAFPQKPWPVTARLLLGHLAGVRHYTKPGESSGTQHFFTVTESLKLFANDPLLFEPGTKYSYTTYGFSVLGCAIEGASKMSYGDYMRTRVFEPAGMTRTSLDDVYLVIPNRARGYFLLDQASFDQLPPAGKAMASVGHVYNASLHDTSMKMPGGGILSTPTDLMMFANALFDGKLLKPETLKLMWTSQKTADGKPTEYGYGWGVGSNPERQIVSHSGNQAGASSMFIVDVTNRLALAIMTNIEDANLSEVRKVLTGPLSPTGKYSTPPMPSAAPAAPSPAGEPYSLRTPKGTEPATLHRIEVAENRARPQGARITLAVVRLPATAPSNRPPVMYLAGGPGQSGIAAAQISDTYEVLQRIRRSADVLLLDQRGTGQSVPRVSCQATQALAPDVFASAAAMQRALEPGLRGCLETWRARGVDLTSYNTEASADDVADVAKALNIPRLALFGFSYGTHLAASVVRRHPDLMDRVVFAGFEGPDDNEKYPAVYDRQVAKISALAATQADVAAVMPDFTATLKSVLTRAEREPFAITVQAGGSAVSLPVGKEGLLYLLRRDIGDTNDLPVFPTMIWQLSRNETALLAQYAQRRYQQMGTGVSLMSIAMDCASGASVRRRAEVAAQLPSSIFGVMTNPLSGQCDVLGIPALSDAYRLPITTRVPALFVSGTLDSNTPPEQVERARPGFANSTHLIVERAGHESTLIPEVTEAIAGFFRGDAVTSRTIKGPAWRFEALR